VDSFRIGLSSNSIGGERLGKEERGELGIELTKLRTKTVNPRLNPVPASLKAEPLRLETLLLRLKRCLLRMQPVKELISMEQK